MLTQKQIDEMLNASREADEGPTQLARRIEAAVQAAERERWRDKVEALAGSWDDPAEAYGMKLALQEGLGA